jgi:anaerobic magnesium-protoporphyrin IX monomethyl ester cyclase
MRILLSTPPWKTTELWPPLGLLYIAGAVKRAREDEVVVVDAFCENLAPEQLVERAREQAPDVVGMNCSTHTFAAAMAVLEEIKRQLPEVVIVLGGYHATFAAPAILREYPFVDYIIKGEAEVAFPKLLDHIEAGTAPADVEGIVYRTPDGVEERPLALVEDLDALPFPDRGLLGDVEYGYYFQGIPLTFGRFTTISSSRGCPFSCSYCSCAAFSERRWRYRSAANVVDELEMLYRQGYRECVFVDDNFTHKVSRVEEICRLIEERGIRMKLYCEGRANHASLPLLKTMKKAGFNVIYFGAESASPHVLKYYNKKLTAEQNAEAVANAKRAGMLVITSYIVGAPVETKDDIRRTIAFAESLRPHGVQYNILDMLIGTPLWEELKEKGRLGPEDWKTNHRVYEYYPDRTSQEELESLVNDGYGSFIGAWKSFQGLRELARIVLVNPTARSIVLRNVRNPAALGAVKDGLRAFK